MTDTRFTSINRELAELNECFLGLVGRGCDAGFASGVLVRIRGLDKDARRRLAAVPLALFSLDFEDHAGWDTLLSIGVRDLESAYPGSEPAVANFTLLALVVLRSLARCAPHAVSAWIGLPSETRSRLAALEIGSLGLVAPLAAPRLSGCLSTREALWLRLLEAAGKDDQRQLAILAALAKQWAIRRSLGLSGPMQPVRGFRR